MGRSYGCPRGSPRGSVARGSGAGAGTSVGCLLSSGTGAEWELARRPAKAHATGGDPNRALRITLLHVEAMMSASSPTLATDPVGRILSALVAPLFLWWVIWAATGFSVAGEDLQEAAVIWAILYVPLKLLRLMLHKESGWFRESQWLKNMVYRAGVLLWLGGCAVSLWVGFSRLGILGIFPAAGGAAFCAYILHNFIGEIIFGAQRSSGRE